MPHLALMSNVNHLTALALARAMLAGPATVAGLVARMAACLGGPAAWMPALAQRCCRLSLVSWLRLTRRSLAALIERDPGYQAAWLSSAKPFVRRHILRVDSRMQAAPLGLHECELPHWPNSAALAQALGISLGGLWRLCRPSAWQRRAHLGGQHYHCQLWPKRSGGWRLLEVPAPYLMPLQRRLLGALLNQVPVHEAAHGFMPGGSVVQHAQAHLGQAVVLKFDLRDFFSTVRAARVHALFTTLGYPDGVARALTALCTTATPEPVLQRWHEQGSLSWQQRQRLRDPHLPQGAPTSPALANLCAFKLDLRLAGLATSLGARYTRYADDLVLSGPAHLRRATPRIAAWVAMLAADEGFVLNQRKTRCLSAARQQTVCNMVVNQRLNVPRCEFDVLKATLHQCVLHGPHSQNRAGHADWQAHLRGRVGWVAQLNPNKALRLQRLFNQIDWQPH